MEDWQDRFLLGGEKALRSRPNDAEALGGEEDKASMFADKQGCVHDPANSNASWMAQAEGRGTGAAASFS